VLRRIIIIMAEQAEGVNIFVYLGGEQEVPYNITHVRIDRSVKIIPEQAFQNHENLVSVETHDGIEKIEQCAFNGCISLRGIELPGVREVGYCAFFLCRAMTDVEFGDNWKQSYKEHSLSVALSKRLKCHLFGLSEQRHLKIVGN
jgi:hypothetical protein